MDGIPKQLVSDAASATRDAWVARCCARISEHDAAIQTEDARDLALTLWDRPSCRELAPEQAADLMFEGKLSSSQWGDL